LRWVSPLLPGLSSNFNITAVLLLSLLSNWDYKHGLPHLTPRETFPFLLKTKQLALKLNAIDFKKAIE
jgi:hypothetical protein